MLNKTKIRILIKRVISGIVAVVVFLLMIISMRQSDFSKINKYNKQDTAAKVISYNKNKPTMQGFNASVDINKGENLANLGDFVFNVAGDRILIANISLKYKSYDNTWLNKDKIEKEIVKKNVIIRDAIINTMLGSTFATANSKKMRQELRANISKNLQKGEIKAVYFNQFILQ